MIIFNSIKNKKWSGDNFEITKSGSIIMSSRSLIYQDLILTPGDYSIKIILKKISGEGGCSITIDSQGISIFSEKIQINDKKTVEIIKNLEIRTQINGTIFLKKVKDTIGRTEIISIRIQKIKDVNNDLRLDKYNKSTKENNEVFSFVVFDELNFNNNIIDNVINKIKKNNLEIFIFNENNIFSKEKYKLKTKYFFEKKIMFEYFDLFGKNNFILFDNNDYQIIKNTIKIKKAIIYDSFGKINIIETKTPIIFNGYLI